MEPIEIPLDDLQDIDILGDDPVYRFEELLNDMGNNELEMVLQGYLGLDVHSDHIGDYEIKDTSVVLYIYH